MQDHYFARDFFLKFFIVIFGFFYGYWMVIDMEQYKRLRQHEVAIMQREANVKLLDHSISTTYKYTINARSTKESQHACSSPQESDARNPCNFKGR